MPLGIYNRLVAMANWRWLVGLGALLVALSLVFVWAARQLPGGTMIDGHASYTPREVYQWIADYGPAGRSLHGVTTLIADTLYPFNYALFFALLIIASYRRAFPKGRMARPMAVFPFVTALCDLLENACIVIMLANYPQQITWVAQVSSLFTSLKWGFFVISVVLVGMGLVGLGLALLRPKTNP